MGLTLAKAAEWTSSKEGSGGKLEYTSVNQQILQDCLKFVENFTKTYPESDKLVFKQPLIWFSTLTSESFLGHSDYKKSGDLVESEAALEDGTPHLKMNKVRELQKFQAEVLTFRQLEYTLKVCESVDHKLAEVRACVESNRDPVAKMLGDKFAYVEGQDNALFRCTDELLAAEKSADESAAEKRITLRLALEFQKFDMDMLQKAVVNISKAVRLNPIMVEHEVSVLQNVCGDDSNKYPLISLQPAGGYTYVFSNGCRAPPWRQVYGDIAYFLVQFHDVDDDLCITASTDGWVVNEGFNRDKGEVRFNRAGDTYKNLTAILREKSPKFTEAIEKQENIMEMMQARGVAVSPRRRKSVSDQRTMAAEKDGGTTARGEDKRAMEKQTTKADSETRQKDASKKYTKIQPAEASLRWKNLGLYEEPKPDTVQRKEKKERKSVVLHGQERKSAKSSLDHYTDEGTSESESDSDDDEEIVDRRTDASAAGDLPSEYWQIQKLVKYLKGGNQTATVIALCAIRDFNLSQETCQLAVRDVGGLEILINLLETSEVKCKIGALKILKEISRNVQIRKAIADVGGLQTLIHILKDSNKDLRCLAAETIANVAKFSRARRTVRQHGGVRQLVSLLDIPRSFNGSEQQQDIEVARAGASALWSCSKSHRNKVAMRKAGVIPLLARLLKSNHENLLIPVVGTLQECASEPSYRLAIRTEGMLEDLVRNLGSSNEDLQMHCASAIFKCAEDKETRDLVHKFGGFDPLAKLLTTTRNKEVLAAVTGAIWKAAVRQENVEKFQQSRTIEVLVGLLNNQPEEVLINVVGALGECAKEPANRTSIRKAGGISSLINLLTGTNRELLINTTRAIAYCAEEPESMAIIDKMDGVRLLWSLLKNSSPEVQASAAWAICPCIQYAKDSGELVRSFVGGLELVVNLLRSENREVLAATCAAVAQIAKDDENLAVITDHGVCQLLSKLTPTTDDKLRRYLAEAIANCCSWGKNRETFGKEGAVAPLVGFLKSKETATHRSTARALFELSREPDNCITMHDFSVVKHLIGMVGAKDDVLQEAAAGCIANIRKLALANERAKRKPVPDTKPSN